MNISRA